MIGIQSNVFLFAGNTWVGRNISSEECVEKLQAVLDELYYWKEKNNMKFN
jgi:hypothetical protein